MSDKVRLCHSFHFSENPNLKFRKLLTFFYFANAKGRLPGGMATPFINLLVCFRKRVRFPAEVRKKAVSMTAFFHNAGALFYFTSQMSLVSRSSLKVWYFLAAFTSSICAVTASS